MRKLPSLVTAIAVVGVVLFSNSLLPTAGAQIGSGIPSDAQLTAQRQAEVASGLVVAPPPAGTILKPVLRVPRDQFGVVGHFPLKLQDLQGLIYPDATAAERQAVLEGMQFFTTPHTAAEGAGPMANQPFCLGCHMSTAEQVPNPMLVTAASCMPGSTCVSNVSRAARSTPTNFFFTSLDPATGGGRAPDNLDAINNTGRTAAFTLFGDFSPSLNAFDPLDGAFVNPVTKVAQQFGGTVQHTRPSIPDCLPDRIPPVAVDVNLAGNQDPATGLWPTGFRRTVGERAGPPYIGRGLMEAVPNVDILANEDPNDAKTHQSSLQSFATSMGCSGDCISGVHNEIPARGGFVGGVGRFGLRANGVEILQFVTGGLQGELGFTSLLNNHEINIADINANRPGCNNNLVPDPEVHLSTPFSERNFLRNTAPPEFGEYLLKVLGATSGEPGPHQNPVQRSGKGGGSGGGQGNGNDQKEQDMVRRGAELFGIDLTAFANRMIAGRMPASGDDGLDANAINQADRKLNCVGCHIPVQRTGQSPADVGAEHLTFVWAPIFSDLLIHKMPVIDAERWAVLPRNPLVVPRIDLNFGEDHGGGGQGGEHTGGKFKTFDISRNLADDVFSSQQGSSTGREFRTAPLMGMGRMGPPFLHDARVYLSALTVGTTPAGTVTSSSKFTNAPLVIRTLEDAIRAAIELHDLPAPDDSNTSHVPGGGCPVPPVGVNININYGASPQDVICPAYDSPVSQANRSDAREVIRRFRALSPDDQMALIEFLKQL